MPATLPEKDDYSPAHNPVEDGFSDIINNNFSEKSISEMEKRAADSVASGDPTDPRAAGIDDTDNPDTKSSSSTGAGLSEQEERGDAAWLNNTTSRPAPQSFMGNVKNLKSIGGIFAVMGTVVALIGLLTTLVGSALGLINFKETALQKLSQRTADIMERREARILAKRFSKDMTTGGVLTSKRYRGFTDREIKKFNRRAGEFGFRIEATGETNKFNPLRKKVVIVEFDPTKYDPANPDKVIEGKRIPASQFRKTLKNNASFRKATANFYKGNVEFYTGKAAQGFWSRTKTFLGKRSTGEGKGTTEEERQKTRQRELARKQTSGDMVEVRANSTRNGTSGDAASDSAADREAQSQNEQIQEVTDSEKSNLEENRDDTSKNLAEPTIGSDEYVSKWSKTADKVRSMGGGLVNGLAGNPLAAVQGFCMVKALVGAANEARWAGQALQLIRYGAMFGSVADRIKAGDADGDTTQQIGDLMGMLNSTDTSGLTAFDSLGYNWVATGAVRQGKDEDVSSYQNGGPPPGLFGSVVGDSAKKVPDTICKIANSTTVTVISIATTFIPGGGAAKSLLAKAASEGIITIVKRGIEETLAKRITTKGIKDFVTRQTEKGSVGREASKAGAMYAFFDIGVPPLISKIARVATNTVVTGDEVGRSVGNAAISGLAAASSQSAKAQGMMPISRRLAVAVDQTTSAHQLQLAKEEGVNQLDITNQYSFGNKFATLVTPSITRLSSVSRIPSVLASLNTLPLVNLSTKTRAEVDPEVQYQYCKDDHLDAADVAGDPFCNPQYGMPINLVEGNDYDPEKVAEYLYNSDYISDDGTPKGAFQTFIEKCINTNSPLGDDPMCTKTNQQDYTMMRFYCMDTSIDNDMNDGEGTGCAPQQKITTDTPLPAVAGEVSLADLYKPSDNIACSAETRDLGVHAGYHSGTEIKLRLCAIDGIPETGETSTVEGANGKLVVNSRVSGVYSQIARDAKSEGVPVSAAEGYRTMERQQYFWNLYQSGRGNLAAKPGYSNHQAGVAVDWSPPMYNWLSSQGRASRYGLQECTCGEQWHYSFDGK